MARRTSHPPVREYPRSFCCWAIVTLVARSSGFERNLGDRLIEHPLERRPPHLLLERKSSSSLISWRVRGGQAKVHAHGAPLLGRIDRSEAILVHTLHPQHARPPTRKVVRVGDHSPDGMG